MMSIGVKTERVTAALLAELADLPYFRVDAERNVVEVSPAMERLTGFRAEDVLGRSCLRLHRCEECLRGCGVFENGTVRDSHIQLYRADGTVVDVSKSGRVYLDESGEIVGALEIVRPVDVPKGSGAHGSNEPEGGSRSEMDGGVEVERARITAALETARYNRTRAARALGMSRTTLWRKMREYGL